jgi:hypothetical protein
MARKLDKANHKTPPTSVTANPYQPSPTETKALETLRERIEAKPPVPRLSLEARDGQRYVEPKHKDIYTGFQLIMNSCGVTDPDLMSLIITQLGELSPQGLTEDNLNQMMAVVRAVQPSDELEALLAAQMAATQMLTMSRARILMKAQDIGQQDSASNAYNKLARTFTTQMAALKHHRTGDAQGVLVQRVDVRDGGQAIVGNVTAGG